MDAQLCKVIVKYDQHKLGLTLSWLDVADVHYYYTVAHQSVILKPLSGEVKYILFQWYLSGVEYTRTWVCMHCLPGGKKADHVHPVITIVLVACHWHLL